MRSRSACPVGRLLPVRLSGMAASLHPLGVYSLSREMRRAETRPPHAPVLEAQGVQLPGIVDITAIHHDGLPQGIANATHVQVLELVPLRGDHQRVCVTGYFVGVLAELDVS